MQSWANFCHLKWARHRSSELLMSVNRKKLQSWNLQIYFESSERISEHHSCWQAYQFSHTPPLQIHASTCGICVALLCSSRDTFHKQLEVQLTLMWPTFIVEQCWLLQGVNNMLSLRIDVGICRWIVKEFRKASGGRISNFLWLQLLDIKPTLHSGL